MIMGIEGAGLWCSIEAKDFGAKKLVGFGGGAGYWWTNGLEVQGFV